MTHTDLVHQDFDKVRSYFLNQNNIAAVYIFGSAAKARSHSTSDLDVAVMFVTYRADKEGFIFLNYLAEMEGLIARKIDLVCFNTADSLLKHQIMKYGQILIDKNPKARVDLMVKAMVEYEDYKRQLDLSFQMMKQGLRNNE
jgi:predicted nucleotidyltransferase